MQLEVIDIAIIAAYLVIIVISGFILSKRAAKNLDAYFLAGKSIPWYILSISNASSMFDITGTMFLVYLLFAYGLKGVWLPWMWPTFNQIFGMVYISIWIRRSNVLTGEDIGAPDPDGDVDHAEDLVEGRPHPGQPDAFEAVGEEEVDQEHGAGDVEHAGGVGDAEDVPGDAFAGE